MKNQVFYRILLLGSLLFNIVFIGVWLAHAVPRHFAEHDRCGHGRRQCAIQKSLSMSDSQWTLLKPGAESLRGKNVALCHEIAKNRAALLDELEKTATDSTAVARYAERILACQKEMQTIVTDHILEEKKMLTQDQRERYFKKLRGTMSCAGFAGMTGMPSCGNGTGAAIKEKCAGEKNSSNNEK
jgi:hypothetical protein